MLRAMAGSTLFSLVAGVVLVGLSAACGPDCPEEADSCPASCHEVRAYEYFADDGCLGPLQVVGCTAESGGVDEVGCVVRLSDDTFFVASSASQFEESDRWETCPPDTVASVLDAEPCE